MADKTVTYNVKIPVDTNAGKSANDIEALRQRITTAQDAVKGYSNSLRLLRGKSDEVTGARERLKKAIDAERESISRAVVALERQGTVYSRISPQVAALSQVGSTIAGVFLAGAAAIGAAAVALEEWILKSANAQRSMQLFREAETGSAQNATNFGAQIQAIARKVPLTIEELQNLSLETDKAFRGARLSGQGIVDVFQAVSKESSAMGASAGKALQSILERGKLSGRFGLGFQELAGAGLGFQFEDVAGSLAKRLKISLSAARNQLVMGRVELGEGAAAINDLVESKFGKINARRMLDLDVQAKKFKDTLANLTSGVNITPILEGFQSLAEVFDTNTVTGNALKQLVTDIGDGISSLFGSNVKSAKEVFQLAVLGATRFQIKLYEVRNAFYDAIGGENYRRLGDLLSRIDLIRAAFEAVKFTVVTTMEAFAGPASILYRSFEVVSTVYKRLRETDWAVIGANIWQGLVSGIDSGITRVKEAILRLVGISRSTMAAGLESHSPSKVFERFGQAQVEGNVRGIESGLPQVSNAVSKMIMVPALSGNNKSSAGASNQVSVSLNFPNATNGQDVANTLTSTSFRAKFVQVLEEMLRGAGSPTLSPVGG